MSLTVNSELQFSQPVEVGSLLVLDSRVTFSPMVGEHKSFHVSVEAATVDLETGAKKITNTFHFTYSADKPLDRHVLPRTYRQAMQWLDAQRRRAVGIEVRKTYESP
jgi:acyl-coenzyme A thioesterase 9